MILNSLLKALILANYKAFVKLIDLKNNKKCLAYIKLKKDTKNIFLLYKTK